MARRRYVTLANPPVKQAATEPVEVEQPADVAPVELAPIPPVDEPIILHFLLPVEVYINGKAYKGKNVEVPDYEIAAEVVRIAKGAYGNDIMG